MADSTWFACAHNPFDDQPAVIGKVDLADIDGHRGFAGRFRNRLPVVVCGLVDRWPAFDRWRDGDYLKSRLAQYQEYCVAKQQQTDEVWTAQPPPIDAAPPPPSLADTATVPVMIARDGLNFLELDAYVHKEDVAVSTLVESVFAADFPSSSSSSSSSSERRMYARIELPRPMIDDVALPFQLFAERVEERNDRDFFSPWNSRIWIGSEGNITPTHLDRAHGVLCQIRGTKRVIMFAPEDTSNLYPFSGNRSDAHVARANIHAIFYGSRADQTAQLSEFPKVKRAQPYVCDLLPGEILYIPPGWWHCVVSATSCISISFPFGISCTETMPANLWR